MIVIRKMRLPPGKPFGVQMRGAPPFVVTFHAARIHGQECTAAQVDDGHERADDVRAWANGHAGYYVYAGDPNAVQWGTSDALGGIQTPAPNVPMGDPTVHPAEAMALQMGWGVVDLLGTCENNDPTENGGISPRSGLSLSEMALCKPPEDWHEQWGDTHWPWERPDWGAPGLDFQPRHGLPPKRAEEPSDSPPADNAPGLEPGPADEPSPEFAAAPDAPAQPAADLPVEPDPTDEVEPPADDEPQDPSKAADGDLDLTAHTALITELREAADGQLPTWQKFRHHQTKRGLDPQINKATYDGLIEQLQ